MNAPVSSEAGERSAIEADVDAIVGAPTDPLDASERLSELAEHARDRGWPDLDGRASYAAARNLVQLGRIDEALVAIDRARSAFRAAGAPLDAARCELGRMHAFDVVGRHEDNIAAGRAMLDELDELGSSGDAATVAWLRAAAAGNLGAALGATGRHQEAIEAHLDSAGAFDELGSTFDAALGRANAGIEHLALGDAVGASQLLEPALGELRVDGSDPVFEAKCQVALGRCFVAFGEIHRALVILDDAQLRLRSLGAEPEAVRADLAVAQALLALDLPEQARDVLTEVVDRLDNTEHAEEWSRRPDELALALVLSAELADEDSAARLLDRALAAATSASNETLALLARIHRAAGRRDAASVRELHTEARTAGLSAHALVAAALLADLGDASHLAWATTEAMQLGLPARAAELTSRLGEHARSEERLDDAIAHHVLALRLVLDVRSRLGHVVLRSGFDGGRSRVVDGLVSALLRREEPGDRRRARDAVDDVGARTLVELRADRAAGVSLAAGDDGLDANLAADLAAVHAALVDGPHERSRDALHDRRGDLEDRLRRRLAAVPAAADARFDPRTDASSDTGLGTGSTASGELASEPPASVVFHRGRDGLLAFVTDPASGRDADVVRLPASVDDDVLRFEARRRMGTATQRARVLACEQSLDAVARSLLAPLHLDADHPTVVVPTPGLRRVPFPAASARLGGPLTSMAPSVGALEPPPTRPRRTRIVLVAPSRAQLPGATAEIDRVAARWPGAATITGRDATIASITAAAAGADVLHIATHGSWHRDGGWTAGLMCEDGWLPALTLAGLDLRGTTVVLSGCDTAVTSGSDPTGLAPALLAAGATAVVGSLWPVADDDTVDFMDRLHAELAAGESVTRALDTAARDHRSRHPHPTAWAAFAVIGDPRS